MVIKYIVSKNKFPTLKQLKQDLLTKVGIEVVTLQVIGVNGSDARTVNGCISVDYERTGATTRGKKFVSYMLMDGLKSCDWSDLKPLLQEIKDVADPSKKVS